ncbi:Fur family transcriptional regulator [Agaribacterium haliotis]|uniref:Fur family transcriptional regulator n=1 Tax=Agaribacterium haliotis TaxID=2013869 RepID=UPI000BB561CD|nr:Fur family transcriptional regulator [Agaribacterium haliotis]
MQQNAQRIEQALVRAEHDCVQAGQRLTSKRKHILQLLLEARAPLSAYEIIDRYAEAFGTKLPAMSVYRMLQFLADNKLAHKLETTNQYLACSHIACEHEHSVPQFLICDKCHKVEELGLRRELVDELHNSVARSGFTLVSQQLELHGLCSSCNGGKS